HGHADHNNTNLAAGAYALKNSEGASNIHGINIRQIKTFHDKKNGKDRGPNLISIFEYDNFRLAHMGDIGTLLSDEEIKKIGRIDAIMIPVGGYYTVDAFDAWEIIRRLSPRIIIPMHYKTPRLDPKNPIDTVDKFIAGRSNLTKLSGSTYEIDISSIPKEETIVLFSPPSE
ncbi:MAG TPA: MBL fold metallo-hydrolase, partial [Candidatus Wallbacteria bacterium]|nr:MBL fold metallo-hydrolase [Candidatus Wallbacteria bacterium]